MFRKLLCPIDFSPSSKHALGLASRLAAEADAELVIAHAWYVPPLAFGEYPIPQVTIDQLLEDERRSLDAAASDARAFGVANVTTRVLEGPPWLRIVDALRDDGVFDLVVIGTHGRTGVTRWVLGSVAEQVVRHAPCSVLVARGRGEHTPFVHVECAVDFSDSSCEAVRQAGQLVAPASEGLELLHIVQPPAAARASFANADVVADFDRRMTMELERWAARIEPKPRAALGYDVRVGDPASEVLAAIEGDDTIDLVAVGTHGRTGLRRMLLGSVAEKIVRHAPCPVLVARARG